MNTYKLNRIRRHIRRAPLIYREVERRRLARTKPRRVWKGLRRGERVWKELEDDG